ncbi:hypothetical protein B0H14DRAFT_2616193 [Mycena olivaceomarginata]|nr:hypothetical protein B0H14DRAFT_2616193 [Mycena olivaceomarginata]
MTHLNSPAPGTGNSVPEAVNKGYVGSDAAAGPRCRSAPLLLPLRLWPRLGPLATPSPGPAIATPSSPAPPTSPWVAGAVYHVVPPTPLGLTTFGENEPEGPWYSITRGLHVGVTINNAIAVGAISGVSRGAMSKHKTQPQAVAAFNEALTFGLVASFMSDGRRVNT